ncbi:MAG TPA: 2-oxoacid:acceptor oxidoreductase family protein [Terriglobales bacterium]|nr:2-oxoacid:acceptor oxidoreductase family protein [Terriglobales bacterium]
MSRQEIRLQGLGGQGIISAGYLIGSAVSLQEHREAVMTEDYSPYITGGWSRADLVISDEPIDYPLVTKPNILVALSQDGFDDNLRMTTPDATIVIEGSMVKADAALNGRKLFSVPALSVAEELGRRVVANMVVLGFIAQKTKVVHCEALLAAIIKRYPKATELNRRAFLRGVELASGTQRVLEVTQ